MCAKLLLSVVTFFIDKSSKYVFLFDWQVKLIITYLENFSHRLTSFEPRHYGVVFDYKKSFRNVFGSSFESAEGAICAGILVFDLGQLVGFSILGLIPAFIRHGLVNIALHGKSVGQCGFEGGMHIGGSGGFDGAVHIKVADSFCGKQQIFHDGFIVHIFSSPFFLIPNCRRMKRSDGAFLPSGSGSFLTLGRLPERRR